VHELQRFSLERLHFRLAPDASLGQPALKA
jgi:hypothetical protein